MFAQTGNWNFYSLNTVITAANHGRNSDKRYRDIKALKNNTNFANEKEPKNVDEKIYYYILELIFQVLSENYIFYWVIFTDK